MAWAVRFVSVHSITAPKSPVGSGDHAINPPFAQSRPWRTVDATVEIIRQLGRRKLLKHLEIDEILHNFSID